MLINLSVSRLYLGSALGLCVLLRAGLAHASTCSHDDIDLYLGKGFTHEQVVRLCEHAVEDVEARHARGEPIETRKRSEDSANPVRSLPSSSTVTPDLAKNETLQFLRYAIDADEIEFYDGGLSYSGKECIKYIGNNPVASPDNICATVSVNLRYKNINVINTSKTFLLLGMPSVTVTGDFEKRVVHIDADSTYNHAQLEKLFASSAELTIHIRSNDFVAKATSALQQLAQSNT